MDSEYKRAIDGLRFSDEEKKQIIDYLIAELEKQNASDSIGERDFAGARKTPRILVGFLVAAVLMAGSMACTLDTDFSRRAD